MLQQSASIGSSPAIRGLTDADSPLSGPNTACCSPSWDIQVLARVPLPPSCCSWAAHSHSAISLTTSRTHQPAHNLVHRCDRCTAHLPNPTRFSHHAAVQRAWLRAGRGRGRPAAGADRSSSCSELYAVGGHQHGQLPGRAEPVLHRRRDCGRLLLQLVPQHGHRLPGPRHLLRPMR